jgi:hypothetical protein
MTTAVWLALAAGLATPTEPADGSWAAWHGCWQVQGEAASAMVCMLPGDAPDAVRIATIEAGSITAEQIVRADGVSRPVDEGGCTGMERAWFSRDGRRVYTRAELNCSGMQRISTGVMAMISEVGWVDAQAVTVGAQHVSRSVQYRAVPERDVPAPIAALLPRGQHMALEAARLHAAAPLDIDAVIEASQAVAAPAVEALLAARAQGFGLDGRKLVQLADAGVPTSTINVMVALSHPTRFAVATPAPADVPAAEFARTRASWADECYDPYWSSRRYRNEYCYDTRMGLGYGIHNRYGSYYGRYGYSPFGYDPYGWDRGGRPVVVIIQPGGGDDSERTRGEVVKGRGYTRTSGSATGTATPRSATTRESPSKPASATTGSSTSSSGSGSSSSEPTRTARPRGGN